MLTRRRVWHRGPGVKAGSSFDFLASNVDLTPTMLSLANIERAPGMDGKSFLPMVLEPTEPAAANVPASVSSNDDRMSSSGNRICTAS